jgi:hypothetical protein
MKKWIPLIATGLVAILFAYFFWGQDGERGISLVSMEEKQRTNSDNPLSTSGDKGASGQRSTTNNEDFFAGKVSFNLVKQQAESGDRVAQRQLSEMYEDCMGYSLGPEKYLNTLDALSDMRPESKPHVEKIKQQTIGFCRHVDGGQPIPVEAYKLWLQKSAESGDLIASIRQSSRALDQVSLKQISEITERVRSSKQPEALYELSMLMDGRHDLWQSEEDQRLFGKSYSNHAIAIAACRSGMNCSATSRLMRQVCTSTFRCGYSNYEQFLFSEMVSPSERREIEGLVASITTTFLHSNSRK